MTNVTNAIPNGLFAKGHDKLHDVIEFARVMSLANVIQKEVKAGATLEECIAKRKPLTDREVIHNDTEQLTDGTEDVYRSMGQNITEADIIKRLNTALGKLDSNSSRVVWMSNWAALSPDLDSETKAEIQAICSAKTHTDADVQRLVELTNQGTKKNAAIYQRRAVKLADSHMHHLRSEYVEKLAQSSVEEAKAMAAASYILSEEKGSVYESCQPYAMGVMAANNVETSRLIALYKQGKIMLADLKTRLVDLVINTLVYIYEHPDRVLAMAIQGALIVYITPYIANVFYLMHCAPVFAVIAGFGWTVLAFTEGITTQDVVDFLHDIGGFVEFTWDMVKKLWNAIFRSKDDLASNPDSNLDSQTDPNSVVNPESDEDPELDPDPDPTVNFVERNVDPA